MSATARAEARRKAILSRGNDRLSKLTTSARGEDGPAYMKAGVWLALDMLRILIHHVIDIPPRGATPSLRNFVGEESSMPPPPDMSRTSPPPLSFGGMGLGGAAPNPSVWSEEQQQAFMQALMGGTAPPQFPQSQLPAAASNATTAPTPGDPLAAMMSSLQQMDPSRGATGKFPAPPAPEKPPSTLRKFMPLLHILCSWCILAYFLLFKEPQVFFERSGGASDTVWKRWAELAWRIPSSEGWGVQFVVSALRSHLWNVLIDRCIALRMGFHDRASYASLDAHIHGECKLVRL